MRRPTRRSALLAATLALSLAPGALAAGAVTPRAAAVPSAAGNRAAATTATLLTGEHVLVRHLADGRPSIEVTPAGGVHGSRDGFSRMAVAGRTYIVPSEARPFVGTVLDPSLFDVATMSAHHGSVPVTLTTDGAAPTVPGLVVTARTAHTVTGRLTLDAKSAAAWRTALRAAAVAAQAHHRTPGSLFSTMTSMSVQHESTPTARYTPHFAQVSLNVRVLGLDGKPLDFGDVALVNTDDSRRFFRYVITGSSGGRMSVPLGHYSAVTQIDQYDDTGLTSSRLVTVADFTVSRNLQTLTLDARTATARPTLRTPQSASVQNRTVEITRASAVGRPMLTWAATVYSGTPLYVTPTPAAKVGKLYAVTSFQAEGTEHTARPYSYNLAFVDTGAVPASLAKVARQSQLADVRSTFVTDEKREVSEARTPVFLFQATVGSIQVGFTVPAVRDEYVYAPAGTRWSDTYNSAPSFNNPYAGTVFDVLRLYRAGVVAPVTWLRGPLAPGVPENGANDPSYACPECRTADTMTVELAHFVDTTPGHAGFVQYLDPTVVHTNFALYEDGEQIAGGVNQFRATVTVPRSAASYRMHLDVDRSDQNTTTSTNISTDLTFSSSAAAGGTLPGAWTCRLAGTCRVVPMLTSSMPLPTNLLGRMPIGVNYFHIGLRSFIGAPSLVVNGAGLQASVDGTTWTQVHLTRDGNGSYTAALRNPKAWAGKPVTLRLSATTADGSSLTQTTTAAYIVAAA